MKSFFSLRMKFILFFVAIFLTALIFYSAYIMNILLLDKQVSISTRGSAVADSLSFKVQGIVRHATELSFSYAVIIENNSLEVQRLLNHSKDLIGFGVYTFDDEKITRKIMLVNDSLPSEWADLYAFNPKILFDEKNSEKLFHPERDNGSGHVIYNSSNLIGVPSLTILNYNGVRNEYYLTIISLTNLLDLFANFLGHTNSLLNEYGLPYIGNGINTKGHEYVRNIIESDAITGQKEVVDYDMTKIITFSKVKETNLIVLSEIYKDDAYNTIELIKRKTYVFIIFLLSFIIFLSILFTAGLSNTIISLINGMVKITEKKFDNVLKINSSDELGLLTKYFNYMTGEIPRFIEEKALDEKAKFNLDNLKLIKKLIFNDPHLKIKKMSLSGILKANNYYSGEFWWTFDRGEDVFLIIGKAFNPSVEAAIILASIKSLLQVSLQKSNQSPAAILKMLNQSIFNIAKGKSYFSMLVIKLNPEIGKMFYSHAGYVPLYKIPDKNIALINIIKLRLIKGEFLGVMQSAEYSNSEYILEPQEGFFATTHSLSKIKGGDGKNYGEKRVLKNIVAVLNKSKNADSIIDDFEKKLSTFSEGNFDNHALLICIRD